MCIYKLKIDKGSIYFSTWGREQTSHLFVWVMDTVIVSGHQLVWVMDTVIVIVCSTNKRHSSFQKTDRKN